MRQFRRFDFGHIEEFINNQSDTTKVYIGCDSERINYDGRWMVDYTSVIVVHIDGNKGCRIFGEINREPDFDFRKNKPKIRLMNEVIKAAELYLKLQEITDKNIEIHLDLNPDEMHGSSCVINEAIGYIRGVCNIVPFVKPDAWAASTAADRYKEVLSAVS